MSIIIEATASRIRPSLRSLSELPGMNELTVISLGKMHPGQIKAYWALKPHRYKILRCGRRFGKTEFAKIWIGQRLLQGWECAWLAPPT